MCLFVEGLCDKVKCDFNGRCVEKEDGRTECVCPSCDSRPEMKAVCGSDERTYASKCHLQSSGCKTKKAITVERNGACSKFGL